MLNQVDYADVVERDDGITDVGERDDLLDDDANDDDLDEVISATRSLVMRERETAYDEFEIWPLL